MGLTRRSVGMHAVDNGVFIEKRTPEDVIIALAGNPNVGKSTVFNGLTGMHQHTGNWPGKTVTNAYGYYDTENHHYILVDIPGTYSLMAHSEEEAVARDFICFGNADAVVVVCDATCLERNLNLVLQTMEITDTVILCVNLLDEAERHHIHLQLKLLEKRLKIPIVGITARNPNDLTALMHAVDAARPNTADFIVQYPAPIENAVAEISPFLERFCDKKRARWLALRLLEKDTSLQQQIIAHYGEEIFNDIEFNDTLARAKGKLNADGIDAQAYKDCIVCALVSKAETVCKGVVTYGDTIKPHPLDRLLTGRYTGYAIMILMLAVIFWLTITGANYPSKLLSECFLWGQDRLTELFKLLNAPAWLHGALVLGVYRVLAWVVSVMLPPMAIFFPLFTLLEDAGFLPRIAYNLDKPFQKCRACGKQALTMCMGFGCNAAGVVGCRIIDSPRERLLAILTNSFVPCNGRFPTLITLLSMFFIGTATGFASTVQSTVLLTFVILLGIIATFLITRLLSSTLLRGIPSSFTLELPPFRRPQIAKVLYRSFLDRTIFVLGRAAAVAAPAGLCIWLIANIHVGNTSLLQISADFLDPFAALMGLDGVILIAFILGFPANEIVLPIIIMAYTASGTLTDLSDLTAMKALFAENGWTAFTAINMMLFSLFHWPCSTTVMTIKKETGSFKWTMLAIILPTILGIVTCMLFTALTKICT